MRKIFTSESVTEGHPDKLCDLIADTLLDEYLIRDKNARVAIEVMVSKNKVFISGEVSSLASLDINFIVRNTIKSIGYFGVEYDIDYKTCDIYINISRQSPDIALAINDGNPGAGDQGIIFGYACTETNELMPFPIMLAHKLSKRLSYVRKKNLVKGLGPDGKTQVSIEYDDDMILRVEAIVVAIQHKDIVDLESLRAEVISKVIYHVVDKSLIDKDTKIIINSAGRFVIAGPLADTGLTGRKLMVDTYGGYARNGGGALSGKDGTKVDRSAAYMARFIAKNIVWNGYAKKCEIQLSYAIGIKNPISISIETFGTGIITDEEIISKIQRKFDLTPGGMIKCLDLQTPIYRKTTNYGHFGKNNLPWEKKVFF